MDSGVFQHFCDSPSRVRPCGCSFGLAKRSVILFTASLMLHVAGCGGHASIHIAPVTLKKLSTTAPLVQTISPDACYYWINEKGKLCIAMSEVRPSLLGRHFGERFYLSLVLQEAPAGTARDYALNRRSLRARYSKGYTHRRAASLGGIAAIWDYGRKRLMGRFRVAGNQQSYSVLTGWKGDRRVLLVGEFAAVENREAGLKILAKTEREAMRRSRPDPVPQPVTGPPREN